MQKTRINKQIKKNTILYSTVRPNQEHYGIIEKEIENLIVSTGFTTIDIQDENIYPKFIFYLLTQKSITDYLQKIGMNAVSSYPSISPGDIGNLKFKVPTLQTQKTIAKVLSDLDAKIELNNKINRELEVMAKTIYDYWFVQFDFPFDFAQGKPNEQGKPYKSSGGKMVYNEELKREIPEGWEVKKISEVAYVKAGGDKPNNFSLKKSNRYSIPVYSNGIIEDGLYGYTNEAKIHEQSITISARGTIGYCVVRNEPFVPIIRLIVITPKLSGTAKYFQEHINSLVFKRSGSVQQQLTVPQISNFNILYPSANILTRYGAIIANNINKIELLKKQNQQLTALRDWLLPMLMNGQVTVRQAQSSAISESEEKVCS